jgi:hypothetical protein
LNEAKPGGRFLQKQIVLQPGARVKAWSRKPPHAR